VIGSLENDAGVAGEKAVTEDAMTPGKIVTASFDIRNLRKVFVHHGPGVYRNFGSRGNHAI
jgi:hypothetical protein